MNWNAQLNPASAPSSVSFRAAWAACLLACFSAGCKPPTTGRVQGYIEGEFIYVASPLAATLKELSVERGQQVKAGDPLFRLEATAEEATRDEALRKWNQAKSTLEDLKKGRRVSEVAALEAQKGQAKVALDFAAKELARQQKLRDAEGAATEQALDAAKSTRDQAAFRFAQLESELQTAKLGAREDQIAAAASAMEAAEATLAKAEWTLTQSVRSAPTEGTVTDTLYRPGEFVGSGKPVVVLLPPTQLKLRTFLPQPWLASVHTGDLLQVFVDGIAEPIPAKVRFISPRAEFTAPALYTRDNRAKFVFLVEASFEPAAAARMHPGQPVDVQIPALASARP
jgi:HlyD family secretion protein